MRQADQTLMWYINFFHFQESCFLIIIIFKNLFSGNVINIYDVLDVFGNESHKKKSFS